jgi:hypothetical protein
LASAKNIFHLAVIIDIHPNKKKRRADSLEMGLL